jgi:hypothetical protein
MGDYGELRRDQLVRQNPSLATGDGSSRSHAWKNASISVAADTVAVLIFVADDGGRWRRQLAAIAATGVVAFVAAALASAALASAALAAAALASAAIAIALVFGHWRSVKAFACTSTGPIATVIGAGVDGVDVLVRSLGSA